jgi:hypothetical protein
MTIGHKQYSGLSWPVSESAAVRKQLAKCLAQNYLSKLSKTGRLFVPQRIRERGNGTSGARDDLRYPADIGVAHDDRHERNGRSTVIGLQIGQVCVPGDIDKRRS